MKHFAIRLAKFVALFAGLIVFASIIARFFDSGRGSRRANCQSNLKQIMLGMQAYTQDYGDRFPPARGNGARGSAAYGWEGAASDYLRSTSIFHCDDDRTRQTLPPSTSNFSDYYFNGRLSSFDEDKLKSAPNTISLGEGNDGLDLADAAYSKTALPPAWIGDTTKPTYRHWSGANYAFADAHIKWLAPMVVVTAPVSSTVFTFAVK